MKKKETEKDPFGWLTPEKAARLTQPIRFEEDKKDYSFEATRQEWESKGFIGYKDKTSNDEK